MVTIRANALIGPELEYTEDIRIQLSNEGTILDISKDKKPTKYILHPSYLLVPGFINAHVHVGDAFLKDKTYGLSLEEAVGSTGIKHAKLSSSSIEEKTESLRNSLQMMVNNGFTTFFDFREGGLECIKLLKKTLTNFPIRGLILGRPFPNQLLEEISSLSDGLGFPDVFSLDEVMCSKANELKSKSSYHLQAIHVSESQEVLARSFSEFGKRDIRKALEVLDLDFVVHATYANEDDLVSLRKANVSVVCCPLSNLYNGLDFPPLETILKKNILLGLGTDNVFFCNPDPFRLMAFSLYSARSNDQKLSPKDVLKSLTVNPGLIAQKKIGQLTVGYHGDLIGLNMESPNLKYSKDVYLSLIHI